MPAFHAGGAWSGVPVRARVGVFDDVIEAVAAQDVRVITRAMDVVGQRARYSSPDPPHTVVLQHLLERVDECATAMGEYALVIADEVDGQAKHRADLSSYREVGTTGYRHRKLTRIVDTLHFAPSHASRLVQAADVIAFLYRRSFTHEETDERSRKAKIAMWRRLQPRVQHELCWFPSPTGASRPGGDGISGRRTKGPLQRALRLCRRSKPPRVSHGNILVGSGQLSGHGSCRRQSRRRRGQPSLSAPPKLAI